jgi:hypothetical protein
MGTSTPMSQSTFLLQCTLLFPLRNHFVLQQIFIVSSLFGKSSYILITQVVFSHKEIKSISNNGCKTCMPQKTAFIGCLSPPNLATKLPGNSIRATSSAVPATSARQTALARISEPVATERPVFPTVGPKSVLLFGATELGFGSTPRFHRR